MNGNSQNKFYRVYLIGFFLILALPVISSPLLMHPPAWAKAVVFRIILSVLVFLFVYQLVQKKIKFSLPQLTAFYLLLALWSILFLATIFSLDPYFSFWDSPHRGGGFLNFSFYIIFAILAFLILKKSDWKKVWNFTIFIGVLVSIIAIFQQFGIFGQRIIHYSGRPPSTLGGPIFLALYLLLLSFLALSFGLKEKKKKRKIFYFLAFSLFIFVIFLTGSRAAYFGLFIGFAYFILTFPQKSKLIFAFKILFLVLTLSGAFGIYYLNTHPEFLESVPVVGRLSIKLAREDPRFSAWLISLKAIKDRPLLGYGPENFSIAFDKYYSPSLPFITKEWGSWYDKAHNFIFEIGVTAGVPALIIYLSLFVSLFWGLQKVKEKHSFQKLTPHAIQATFFAYLTANLFSFDVFSTCLILFLIIGYSLKCLQPNQ